MSGIAVFDYGAGNLRSVMNTLEAIGAKFTLVDDAGNEKPWQTLNLDVCVIDANPSVSKIFFDPSKPFVPGGGGRKVDYTITASATVGASMGATAMYSEWSRWCSSSALALYFTFWPRLTAWAVPVLPARPVRPERCK